MPEDGDIGQAIAPASSATDTASATVSYGLPVDVVLGSVRRLGWAGIFYGGTFLIIYAVNMLLRPPTMDSAHAAMFTRHTVVAAALGFGVCALAWSRKLPAGLMLDLGLLFQVAGAFLIGVAETCFPIGSEEIVHGVSSIAIWVSIFGLVVPTTLGKAILAALASAAMGPLGLLFNHVVGRVPLPHFHQAVHLYLAPALAAVWATALSRYVYRLGKQITRARQLGSYELIEPIGRGGMGEVWRARHSMLARDAAIKLIRREALCCNSEEAVHETRQRFEREAQATASLYSPHTVALYDYGVSSDGVFYYVMEMLLGLDLQDLVERFGPVPAGRTIYILRQICDSLAEAHASGIVHRDIKPRNVFLCRLGLDYDFVKVLDFGLAKLRESSDEQTRLTREGMTTGTPAFMAPEVATGSADIDYRADVYALGCVAYWLLTGTLVFEGRTALATAMAHVQEPPMRPSRRTEMEVPADLESVVMQCLEKDPAARPKSARELSRMLAACEAGSGWAPELAEQWWEIHIPLPAGSPQPELAARWGTAASD